MRLIPLERLNLRNQPIQNQSQQQFIRRFGKKKVLREEKGVSTDR